jgi:RNA polymerase sigma factor (sigma-70 family)
MTEPESTEQAQEASPIEEPEPAIGKEVSWSDTHLIRACLAGNERAWAVLIDRYKRLIYSIPIKYGASPDDAADIFQAVCMEMFSELSNLRKTESLKSWLITVASHQAYHWKKRRRTGDLELDNTEADHVPIELAAAEALAPEQLEEVEREQMLREAVAKLNARCAQMIRLLFYEHPPLPYAEVAQRLGLATGSIGFIRGRCLQRLQKVLTEMGF